MSHHVPSRSTKRSAFFHSPVDSKNPALLSPKVCKSARDFYHQGTKTPRKAGQQSAIAFLDQRFDRSLYERAHTEGSHSRILSTDFPHFLSFLGVLVSWW
jgi:hypothetical protein